MENGDKHRKKWHFLGYVLSLFEWNGVQKLHMLWQYQYPYAAFKGDPSSSQLLKSTVCSATEAGTDCLMHHNTDNRRPVNNKYLSAVTFPLHCIYFVFTSEFLLKVREFFHLTYHSFLWANSYNSLRNKCDLLFNVIISRHLNHQNSLDKTFAC